MDGFRVFAVVFIAFYGALSLADPTVSSGARAGLVLFAMICSLGFHVISRDR
jgi:hypothetical protein